MIESPYASAVTSLFQYADCVRFLLAFFFCFTFPFRLFPIIVPYDPLSLSVAVPFSARQYFLIGRRSLCGLKRQKRQTDKKE